MTMALRSSRALIRAKSKKQDETSPSGKDKLEEHINLEGKALIFGRWSIFSRFYLFNLSI